MTTIPKPPLIALTAGDPAGIGPEVVRAAALDARVQKTVRLAIVGPFSECPSSIPRLESIQELPDDAPAGWLDVETKGGWEFGRPQEPSGRAALEALALGADLAQTGQVDALVTAPVCKEALHLAGEAVEGQTELLARWAGVTRFQMVGVAGDLRVMLLTRHLPLRDALAKIDTDVVADHLRLLDESLRELGFERPKIALAGLNPHAGEAGLLGSEEGDLLSPAVSIACSEGLDVSGPLPPDTVFLQAYEGLYHGVLALYHDQAFIPLKLLSQGRGLTWIAGLHGTAFDIAGKGRANPENLIRAILTAGRWCSQVTPAAGETLLESVD
ncbi:MAG: 4-hydroxythreonine-4-phosphate dehydrogenase [Planctomycetota bacterium]|jgi:4-hydroxythreonine-4-phosphate dehydrogenase